MAVYELPSSFAQRRMWLLARMDPDQPTYNIAWALRLEGELDVGALRRAWEAAVRRHEALRTTFREVSGIPMQVVEEVEDAAFEDAVSEDAAFEDAEIDGLVAGPALTVVEVEGETEHERDAAAEALIRDLARVPMDLSRGPLVHARLVRAAERSHLLGVVMHHVIADGWSFRILFDELSRDYAALRGGGAPVAPEPPIQYADFAIWQHEHAQDGGHAADERFWRAELADAPPALALPTDRAYPPRQTFNSASLSRTIDEELSAALAAVAAKQGTTLFALLLTAYATVLARLSGADDLVIAVPAAARTRPETEAVVGLFMNTVPVRVRPARGMTLGTFAQSVHAAVARALAHQELPYARMVELARPERSASRSPLAQVMFAMEEEWTVPARGALSWRPQLVDNGTAKFELEISVTGPLVRLEHNTDLFEHRTARLVADGFGAVLRALATAPGQRIADVELMDSETLALVTRTWPSAGSPRPQSTATGATALEHLWEAARGDTIIAEDGDGRRTLTGSQMREQARRVAGALRESGVGAGDRVAVLVPRSVRVLPAILGIWLVGAAYVPLDPTHPAQRLAAMLGDAGVSAVLAEGDHPPQTRAAAIDLAGLDAAELDPAASAATLPDLPPTVVAYALFTSGSTGRPKAVEVTHANLGALLDAVRPLLALGPGATMVCVTTFAFDICLVDLLLPVLAGARVVIADADQVVDAARLRRLLADTGASALQCTPSGWRMLADAGGVPPNVTLRISAGEPLPRDLADTVGTGPGVRLWNLYGPTETTIYCGGARVGPAPEPIGIAPLIAGTRLYVLDDTLRPVPPGVIGEVCVGGAGVAAGYLGAPGATAARFVPDPFSIRDGARLYRTGDLGRWRPAADRETARLELLGRADRQLKIRGHRVESGEVEAAVRTHPDVAEAVVALRGGGHDVRLVAYLVSRSGADKPAPDLVDHVRARLPDYMVPAAFVALPRLPLTAAGKTDHRALPEPRWADASASASVAPRTPVEAELAKIFADLLSLPEPPGVTDNFFTLGGHSLTATRLMAEVRARHGVDLPLRALFADPTVSGLAAAVQVAVAAGAGGAR